jgi:RNA polymerase sigma factor FliA
MKALHSLPERQRVVLSLYYFEDMNLKEIGGLLGVTESRISQIHSAAVAQLRPILAELMAE